MLDRIEWMLSSQEYDFVNLSLGPRLPIEDDDVHAWTTVLNDRLSRVSTLSLIAVGNDGEGDSILGLDRVQVPSDCVNALAIGACDPPGKDWQRAPYSSKGVADLYDQVVRQYATQIEPLRPVLEVPVVT